MLHVHCILIDQLFYILFIVAGTLRTRTTGQITQHLLRRTKKPNRALGGIQKSALCLVNTLFLVRKANLYQFPMNNSLLGVVGGGGPLQSNIFEPYLLFPVFCLWQYLTSEFRVIQMLYIYIYDIPVLFVRLFLS